MFRGVTKVLRKPEVQWVVDSLSEQRPNQMMLHVLVRWLEINMFCVLLQLQGIGCMMH